MTTRAKVWIIALSVCVLFWIGIIAAVLMWGRG